MRSGGGEESPLTMDWSDGEECSDPGGAESAPGLRGRSSQIGLAVLALAAVALLARWLPSSCLLHEHPEERALPRELSEASFQSSVCSRNGDVELRAVRGAACPPGWQQYRGAGVNFFDALWDAETQQPGVSWKDSLHGLQTLAPTGVRYFRFFASMYQQHQKVWRDQPGKFWARYDHLMNVVARKNLYVIPSLGLQMWHVLANETLNEFVLNPASKSRALANKYFTEVVSRYKDSSAVLLWELGNELNLNVNNQAPDCHPTDWCFNTSAMVQLNKDLISVIRGLDPARPVSSGFSLARHSAWHNEHCKGERAKLPECKGGYGGTDSEEQWTEMFALQHEGVDVMSAHQYARNECYFAKYGKLCRQNMSVITVAAKVAQAAGKQLFVGEYGGAGPAFTGPSSSDQEFPAAMLDFQVESASADSGTHAFALSALWSWECATHRSNMICVWPNSTKPKESGSNRMVEVLQLANRRLANASKQGALPQVQQV